MILYAEDTLPHMIHIDTAAGLLAQPGGIPKIPDNYADTLMNKVIISHTPQHEKR